METANETPLDAVPDEIILQIAQLCDARSLADWAATSRRMRARLACELFKTVHFVGCSKHLGNTTRAFLSPTQRTAPAPIGTYVR